MTINRVIGIEGSGSELKAVQIFLENEDPYLVIGCSMHGVLLDSFLEQMGIDYRKRRLKDTSIHARASDSGYNAIGMGKARNENGNILIFDRSLGYGIYPSSIHADAFNLLNPYKKIVIYPYLPPRFDDCFSKTF